MDNVKLVERDERTESVENRSYNWGYKVMAYAVLVDVMYRSFRFQEAPWDLFAIVILGGLVVTGYQMKHQILGKVWIRMGVLAAGVALAFAVLAAVVLMRR